MTPERQLIRRECAETLRAWVKQLPEQERMICEWRYGMGAEERMTFREIGVRLGQSTERARQWHGKMLRRLHRWLWRETEQDGWTRDDDAYVMWHDYQRSEEDDQK